MKKVKILSLLITILICTVVNGQVYNQEKTTLTNFLIRMYENAPFEGVKVINDEGNQYLISALTLEIAKYNNESTLHRVASVKAMSQASRFFNGSNITSDLIIHTSEKNNGGNDTEIIETIKENSIGYVKSLELLTNFKTTNERMVFIFFTPVSKNEKTL